MTLEELQLAAAPFTPMPATYRDTSWSGLSLTNLVLQSHLCHPEWDADTHRVYCVVEEAFDPVVVHAAPIEAWLEGWSNAG